MHRIVNGDILRFAAHYRGPKFHAVFCDPPYELGFMNKSWDSRGVSFRSETWAAIRSLLLPGAHLLAFGGTRTFHRIAVAIEDAGFEIRDTLGWLYGNGFPKSHNLHDAWHGYGTGLKPAWEPVIVARNTLVGTVATNCLAHGAGAINVDGARVGETGGCRLVEKELSITPNTIYSKGLNQATSSPRHESLGRWPANIIHDGSDETTEVLGDAARFFYCAKASKSEREQGLDGFEVCVAGVGGVDEATGRDSTKPGNQYGEGSKRRVEAGLPSTIPRANHHPTVKPLALTQYLATLILPPAHIESRILVPFAGSGSECIGAALAGWDTIIGVEREADYARIACARMAHWAHGRAVQGVLA